MKCHAMASFHRECQSLAQDSSSFVSCCSWADLVAAAAPLPAQLAGRRGQLKGDVPHGCQLVVLASILQLPVELLQQAPHL